MDRISAEHKDLSTCQALGLSRSGTLGLIAGRVHLGLVNLDHPDKIIHKVTRLTSKYDVSEIQFSLGNETLSAIAAGRKVELLNWRAEGGDMTVVASLVKHGNDITDLSFHEQETNLITTCSYDKNIHLWDIRTPTRPTSSLFNMTWTSRVCWERISGINLASSHDSVIKIWDIRNPSIPHQYINAHPGKIYSLDFSPVKENQLVSSAGDNTIKTWDVVSNTKKPVNVISIQHGASPVWKVRYTPFGEGLVTLLYNSHMTSAMRREQNNLLLWSASSHAQNDGPVHKFYGHMEAVQEFAWRNIDPLNNRHEYQLVTWSRDATMTLWPIGGHLKEMCGVDPVDILLPESTELTAAPKRKEAVIKVTNSATKSSENKNDSILTASIPEGEPCSSSNGKDSDVNGLTSASNSAMRPSTATLLKRELSNISYGEKIVICKIDLNNRHCIFQTETHLHVIYLEVTFPPNYPYEPPQFTFGNRTTINQDRGSAISKKLKKTAFDLTSKGMTCLDQCLRVYEDELKLMIRLEEKQAMSMIPNFYRDSNVPYPRLSGARFCGRGQLVCFGWAFAIPVPKTTNGELDRAARKTPRALSAISGNAAASGSSRPSITTGSLGSLIKTKIPGSSLPADTSPIKIPKPPPPPPPTSSSKGGGRHKIVRIQSVPAQIIPKQKRADSTSSEPNIRDADPSGHTLLLPFATEPRITIYDANRAIHFSFDLARHYITQGPSIEAVCRYNAKVAKAFGFADLRKLWLQVAKIYCLQSPAERRVLQDYQRKVKGTDKIDCSCPKAEDQFDGSFLSISDHPMGQPMLQAFINHYRRIYDFQTVAMLCAIFAQSLPEVNQDELNSDEEEDSIEETSSVEDEMPPNDVVSVTSRESLFRRLRFNSECLDEISRFPLYYPSAQRTSSEGENEVRVDIQPVEKRLKKAPKVDWRAERERALKSLFLDKDQEANYDDHRKLYSSFLARWHLFLQSGQVGKSCQISIPEDPEIFFQKNCRECLTPITERGTCVKCLKSQDGCVVCNLPILGLSWHCWKCNHGGHMQHMKQYFHNDLEKPCLTGCGCQCIKEMTTSG